VGHEFEEVSSRVLGAAIHVHRELGPGYLESIYHKALRIALNKRGIQFLDQHPVTVSYEDISVGQGRLDFLVEGQLVVELKSVNALHDVHFAQLRSYLKATGISKGLLLNFNASRLEIRRVLEG
jgi:GxxExxY protein